YDLIFCSALLLVLRVGGEKLVREGARKPLALLIGTGIALVGFFILAGPEAASPPFERYALWLVAPIVLSLSLSAAAIARNVGARRVLWASTIFAAFSLATVWVSY